MNYEIFENVLASPDAPILITIPPDSACSKLLWTLSMLPPIRSVLGNDLMGYMLTTLGEDLPETDCRVHVALGYRRCIDPKRYRYRITVFWSSLHQKLDQLNESHDGPLPEWSAEVLRHFPFKPFHFSYLDESPSMFLSSTELPPGIYFVGINSLTGRIFNVDEVAEHAQTLGKTFIGQSHELAETLSRKAKCHGKKLKRAVIASGHVDVDHIETHGVFHKVVLCDHLAPKALFLANLNELTHLPFLSHARLDLEIIDVKTTREAFQHLEAVLDAQ